MCGSRIEERIGSRGDAAVEISRPHLDQARVSLTVTPPPTSVIVNGDRIRLTQILSNLLNSSAISLATIPELNFRGGLRESQSLELK